MNRTHFPTFGSFRSLQARERLPFGASYKETLLAFLLAAAVLLGFFFTVHSCR